MGFENLDSGNGTGYAQFREGDNANAKIKTVEPSPNDFEDASCEYQLDMEFEAVVETDHDSRGDIPLWPNSLITIRESYEHTSKLGKLLMKAGVVRDVLSELGADSDTVDKVMSGDDRFIAENPDENEALAKAVAKSLKSEVLRVGTKHNNGGDYSKVDSFHGLADEDPFSEDSELETDSGDVDEDSEEDSDGPLFGEEDENPDEDGEGDEFV